jgi:hypothetical protein
MKSFLISVAADRARGRRPSPVRALTAAAATGAAAAGITYKLLRR